MALQDGSQTLPEDLLALVDFREALHELLIRRLLLDYVFDILNFLRFTSHRVVEYIDLIRLRFNLLFLLEDGFSRLLDPKLSYF